MRFQVLPKANIQRQNTESQDAVVEVGPLCYFTSKLQIGIDS